MFFNFGFYNICRFLFWLLVIFCFVLYDLIIIIGILVGLWLYFKFFIRLIEVVYVLGINFFL